MGKGIKNRGVQVHKVKTKYNRKDNMKIVSEEMEQDREMEETYTFVSYTHLTLPTNREV